VSPRAKLDRDGALSARPQRTPTLSATDRADGGTQIKVEVTRRPLWGVFGRPGRTERTYGIDATGREVYNACDGKTTVKGIIRGFQTRHKLSRSEAEVAVTTFLKTLMNKGLVVVAVDKDRLLRKKK
jgi:coenzyme PQQ synthesis protein D (PqqD)